MSDGQFWVYILLCENNSLYTGYTRDLQKRWQSHVTGTGRCRYTRSFKPISIAQCWIIDGDHARAAAMKIERQIKKLPPIRKKMLVEKPDILTSDPHVRCVSDQQRRTLMLLSLN